MHSMQQLPRSFELCVLEVDYCVSKSRVAQFVDLVKNPLSSQ